MLLNHTDKIEFKKWRRRAISSLPAICNRVFALRQRLYNGCGFHWALEKTLGYCIYKLQNYDVALMNLEEIICLQVAFEGLFKDVSKIERELTAKQHTHIH